MEIPLLGLRLVVGLTFAAHGAQKLFGAFGGHGIEGTPDSSSNSACALARSTPDSERWLSWRWPPDCPRAADAVSPRRR